MKVIGIQSRPKLQGLTASLAQLVLRGFEVEWGEKELIHLNRLGMKPCIFYYLGWGRYGMGVHY